MNTLDENDNTGVNINVKAQIRQDLNKMANDHYYIISSLANNKTMLYLMQKQSHELQNKLFGGFNKVRLRNFFIL